MYKSTIVFLLFTFCILSDEVHYKDNTFKKCILKSLDSISSTSCSSVSFHKASDDGYLSNSNPVDTVPKDELLFVVAGADTITFDSLAAESIKVVPSLEGLKPQYGIYTNIKELIANAPDVSHPALKYELFMNIMRFDNMDGNWKEQHYALYYENKRGKERSFPFSTYGAVWGFSNGRVFYIADDALSTRYSRLHFRKKYSWFYTLKNFPMINFFSVGPVKGGSISIEEYEKVAVLDHRTGKMQSLTKEFLLGALKENAPHLYDLYKAERQKSKKSESYFFAMLDFMDAQ